MGGGEIFVPKIPSMRVTDIAEAIAPDAEQRDDRDPSRREAARGAGDRGRVAPRATSSSDSFVILPEYASWQLRPVDGGRPLAGGFRYSSDKNDDWLDVDELREHGGGRRGRRREHADVPPVRPSGDRRGGHRGGGRGAARRLDHAGADHRSLRGGGRRSTRRARTSSPSRTGPQRSTAPPSRPGSAEGDEAVTTPLSFAGSSNCVLYQGGTAALRRHLARDVEPRHARRPPRRSASARRP